MDSTKMAAEVREWLEESGILKEMQARLRAKMIERLMDKNRKGSRLKTKHASQPRGSAALNSLFLEHLLHTKLWYTAAVFTREATDDFGCEDSFVERPNQMKIDDCHSDTSPQKVNEEHLSKILTRLNWPRRLNNDALRVAYYSRQNHSLAEALFDTVASDNKGGVTNLDTDGILDKLSEIERLLEDRKRHGVIKDKLDSLKRDVEERSITEEKSGRSFVSSEESYSKTNVNSEVESLREDLRRTNEELTALKEARMDEIEDLKQIVRSQNEQLERLKVSRDVDLKREPIESDQRVPNTVDGFVQRVRSKVDVLCMDSNSIDKELCEM